MSVVFVELLIFFVSLLINSFMAFIETAFTSLRLYKVKELEKSVSGYDGFFKIWQENPQRILISILVASNFFGILASVMISRVMEENFGEIGLFLGVSMATFLMLVVGDIIPKTFAKVSGEASFSKTLSILRFLVWAEYYLVSWFLKISNFFLGFVTPASGKDSGSDEVSEKEIEFLIGYGKEKGVIESEKSQILKNIFSISEKKVKEIMVPKTDVVMISCQKTVLEALDILSRSGFSRAPVFKEREDNILGFVLYKDLVNGLEEKADQSVDKILRPLMVVYEEKMVSDFLAEILKKKSQMALAVDQSGVVTGLVTLEDGLEQIVGEIKGEYEKEQELIKPLKDGGFLVDAGISLKIISEFLKTEFKAQTATSLSGFIIERLKRIPKKGETLSYKDFILFIDQASETKVFKIKIFKNIKN